MIFRTITADDWKRAIKRGRTIRNDVATAIYKKFHREQTQNAPAPAEGKRPEGAGLAEKSAGKSARSN